MHKSRFLPEVCDYPSVAWFASRVWIIVFARASFIGSMAGGGLGIMGATSVSGVVVSGGRSSALGGSRDIRQCFRRFSNTILIKPHRTITKMVCLPHGRLPAPLQGML